MAKIDYRLRYLSLFEADLTEIIDYITYQLKNQQAAYNLLNDIERAIFDRLENPESFEPFKSLRSRRNPYYRIYVNNFVIYYVVIDNKTDNFKVMEVRRILYNKRDKNKLI